MATPKWVTDAIAKGDVVTVTPQETFPLDLRKNEVRVLMQSIQKALPYLPDNDGWLAFQVLGELQVMLDKYGKESA